jgi:ABC-type microcin C transport system duplicated ATPase subunit YejF
MRKYADMAFNAMRHPLYWEFRKWKLSDVIAKDALRSLNKKELVDKVIADDMAIHAAKGRLERMEEAIDHLNLQRDNLLQHFISGQKLAIALVRSHY